MPSLKRVFHAVVMLAAVVVPPALAQSEAASGDAAPSGDYDYNRPCRYYLVRHLPAPARCLVEFQGSWGVNAYIDGDFIFRDRNEWLRWRDREDYKHWRKHEFHWSATQSSNGAAPSAPEAPPPAAPPPANVANAASATPPAASPVTSYVCPAQVTVRLSLSQPVAGWSANDGEFQADLDASNPPHFSGSILTCYYRLGGQPGAFMLYRSVSARQCTARRDGTGIDCTP
ncbi:MAG: hypothetical protein KGJ78_04095 [Alphaproteobacteria bacterium]|nr:hypothetical protein [Alphaproteobacteria bacterium]